jgi:hypothetical protein
VSVRLWNASRRLEHRQTQGYYNGHRAHAALEGQPPEASPDASAAQASIHSYRWRSHCRGLYQTPIAA